MEMPKFIQRMFSPKNFGASMKTVTIENDYSNTGVEAISDSRNLNQYKESLYLFIGVNMIARRVAGAEFDLYQIKRANGESQVVDSHDLLEVLHNPNPRQTRKELWELTAMFYLLAGDAFWYLERPNPNAKKVTAIHALRPDYIEVILNPDKTEILAYEYRSNNGTVTRLRPEDILHFKNPDPTNTLRGVGVVRPASSRIITEREASNYQAKFFKNQGRPDVAVFVDAEITSQEAEDARNKWREVYGQGNGGMAGFFGNDVKAIKELNVSPKEMDFIQSQNFLRDDILASLGIPKAMVTSDDVNLANAKTAKVVFLENAVMPVIDMFKDIINNKFLPAVDDTLFIEFEEIIPEDRELLLKEVTQLTGKVLTQNESRSLMGYEEVEGGNELAPVTFAPTPLVVQNTARSILKKRPVLAKKMKAIEALAETIRLAEKMTEPKRGMNPIFATKESQQAYAKAYHKNLDSKIEETEAVVKRFFNGMTDRIIERNKDGFAVDGFMDTVEEKTNAKNLIGGHLKSLIEEHGQEVLQGLFRPQKDAITDGEEFVFTEEQQAKYDERASFFAGSIVDTAFDNIKSVIEDGLASGDGVEKIGRNLRSAVGEMAVWKGRQIAQTETGYALSMATNDAYEQSTVVTGKQWVTVGDARVRDEHAMNNGVVVDKNGVFPNGERYPAERTINCRCVLAPAV